MVMLKTETDYSSMQSQMKHILRNRQKPHIRCRSKMDFHFSLWMQMPTKNFRLKN